MKNDIFLWCCYRVKNWLKTVYTLKRKSTRLWNDNEFMPSNLHAFLWRTSTHFVTSSLTTQNGYEIFFFFIMFPANCAHGRGGILFSHPSISASICPFATFWFSNIFKRQWRNFIKFGKHIDIHKMNIYLEKWGLGANSCFCVFLNNLNMQWLNFIKFGKHIDIHKMNIYKRKIRARGQFLHLCFPE